MGAEASVAAVVGREGTFVNASSTSSTRVSPALPHKGCSGFFVRCPKSPGMVSDRSKMSSSAKRAYCPSVGGAARRMAVTQPSTVYLRADEKMPSVYFVCGAKVCQDRICLCP